MRAGVGGEHLPDDGELIGACEDIGEDEGEPELAHILLRLAEKEQVQRGNQRGFRCCDSCLQQDQWPL